VYGRRLIGGVTVIGAAIAAGVTVLALVGPGGSRATSATTVTGQNSGSTSFANVSNSLAASIDTTQAQLRDEPGNWLAWATLGAAYVQQGRATADPTYYPKAQKALERSLALSTKDNFVAMVGMATLEAARHDFHGALRWSQRALQIDAQSAAAYAVMTDALNELGQYDAAISAVQHAVDLAPGVSTFTRVSYVRELRGDMRGAVVAMQQARDDATDASDIAFCNYYLGELAFGAGDLAGALKAYSAGLQVLPSSPMLHEGRAKVEAARGQAEAAIRDYTTTVETLPLPQYAVEFGDYLTSLHRTAEAARQYGLVSIEEQLFRANGVNGDLDITLFAAEHGQAAAAVAAGRAEWSRRHSIIVADAYGWALHKAGNDRGALPYAQFATSLGFHNAMYYFHKGVIEQSLGQRSAARSDLTHALGLNPYFSPLYAPQARALLEGALR
jgi:tetratricopeptide (TPR) repeat protein